VVDAGYLNGMGMMAPLAGVTWMASVAAALVGTGPARG
jgi:hypothetical protein